VAAQLGRLLIERTIGGDQQVIAAHRGFACQLEPDAARGAGDDGEWT
jgi:hypothetical protein